MADQEKNDAFIYVLQKIKELREFNNITGDIPTITVINFLKEYLNNNTIDDLKSEKGYKDIIKFLETFYNQEIKVKDENNLVFINMANEHSEEAKQVINYIKMYLNNVPLEDIDAIITYVQREYKNQDILNGNANKLLDNISSYYLFKSNSVSKEEVKTNKIVSTRKTNIKRIAIIAALSALVVSGIICISINNNKNVSKKEINNYITSYLNEVSPQEIRENVRYIEGTNIINRNSTVSDTNDGRYVQIYFTDGIVKDILEVYHQNNALLDSVLMNTYLNMNVDLSTKLKNMDIIVKDLIAKENPSELNNCSCFLQYMINKVGLFNSTIENILAKYEMFGYSSLTEEEINDINLLNKQYVELCNDIFKGDKEDFNKLLEGVENGRSSRA